MVAISELDELPGLGLKRGSVAADRSLVVKSQLGTRISNGESYKRGGIPMDSLITAAARTRDR
jgi:hypothetical protein